MRADLLHQVAEQRDVTNAIVLTHNIDFVFLQSVAMSYLRRCGDPVLTILADADCAAASYQAQRELLDGMGTRYRVVPIRMHPGFVFHPKALLLSGPQHATLYVGSGNLTFGGWRQNGEVWSRYTAAEDGLAVFDEFKAYIESLLTRVPIAGSVISELADSFDPRTKLWTGTAPAGEPALIGRAGGEAALIDSFVNVIGPQPVDELVVCSPYFDLDGDALAALRERIPHVKSLLLHPARGSTLTTAAWARSANGMTRRPCEIRHPHEIEERPAFVHAKFYAAIRGNDVVVVQGSANCSRAALLMSGPRGNAELMTIVRTTAEVFRREWLDALPECAHTELADADEAEDDEAPPPPALQIMAARAEDAVILVVYHPPAATIKCCAIDGKSVAFSVLEAGHVHIPHLGAAAALTIEGLVDGSPVISSPHWVDQEHQLRSTARRRRLEEAVPRTIGGKNWTSDQWIELLQVLGEHLKYTPVRASGTPTPPRVPTTSSASTRRYEDIFAQDYLPGAMRAQWNDELPVGEAHESVRKLLMRWLGIGQAESASPDVRDAPPSGATSQGEGDQPEEMPKTPSSGATAGLPPGSTERMRERLRRILADIESTVTAPEYLENRPPDFLQSDLKMMSVILRFGYIRGWLSNDAFFTFTHTVWASLFLSSTKDPQMGWLEWRRLKASDPSAFIAALSSPQLSAALIAWTLVGIDAPASVERARFILARALSTARVPELWFGGSVEEIAHELSDVLHASREFIDPERIITLWREALAQGEALRLLGEVLEILGLENARRFIEVKTVAAGEMLWQGKAGYCVAAVAGSRLTTDTIKTLKLQMGGTGHFQGSKTLPIRSILDVEDFSRALGTEHRLSLNELLVQVASNVATGGHHL